MCISADVLISEFLCFLKLVSAKKKIHYQSGTSLFFVFYENILHPTSVIIVTPLSFESCPDDCHLHFQITHFQRYSTWNEV